MKLSAALLAMAVAGASARRQNKKYEGKVDLRTPLAADSAAGLNVLSQARRLEQNQDQNADDFTWVAGYSLKFQGCHNVQQWNAEADGEDEPRIQTRRLVRFRLCPSSSCTYEDASGCSGGYGDYVIDLTIFLQAYWQNRLEMQEWNCEYTRINECGCDNDDDFDKDDGWNEESCEYACFMDRSMDYCWEGGDPNNDDDGGQDEAFETEEYLECAQAEFENDDDNRRLEDAEEDALEYFIGPYCAEGGDVVYLGVFTDEFCTNFASAEDDESNGADDGGSSIYYENTGKLLPFSQESLVSWGCVSCSEPDDPDMQENGDDYQDEDRIVEMCEQLYEEAGKCETNLGIKYPNENACDYMEGIKIIRTDGQVIRKRIRNSTANYVLGGFAIAFLIIGAYVYHLKQKLDRAKVTLTD